MTDITRKLELISAMKPGDRWPDELGPEINNNWLKVITDAAGEALAEIQRLRAHERASEKWLAELVPDRPFVMPDDWRYAMRAATIECDSTSFEPSSDIGYVRTPPHQYPEWAGIKLIPGAIVKSEGWRTDAGYGCSAHYFPCSCAADEPKPEPWGSAFAMNTENWK